MPVYVTGAHVTLGDSGRRSHLKHSATLKRPFYFKDTCRTPYFFRTLFVIFSGLILVGSGTIMTITGYKPSLLLPWYSTENNTTARNETHQNSVPEILGEPGPLRIMVYTGPILMGVGFFGVMMAVVLFCEIKDRYLMKVLPTKGQSQKIKKDMLYDIIIGEFRKNYFRGIEVPLRKEERKKSTSKRWSFSLSGSGSSFISFARRHSHDLFKLAKRKHRNIGKPEKGKWKNGTFPKCVTSDSWMKTSSLPNIKHKTECVELDILPSSNQNKSEGSAQNTTNMQCSNGPTAVCKMVGEILEEASGVDNLAYRDSPSNKKTKAHIKENEADALTDNLTFTTVIIHNFSKHNECIPNHLHNSQQDKDVPNNVHTENTCKDSPMDIKSDTGELAGSNYHKEIKLYKDGDIVVNLTNDENARTEDRSDDALGMNSDTSSLTMSWEGGPIEWSDARRNTEPCNLFQLRLNSSSTDSDDEVFQTSTQKPTTTNCEKTIGPHHETKRSPVTFKTIIRVFHSESSLSKPYTLIRQSQHDTGSLDSLELTDEMLKNFEMTGIAHI